MKITRALISVSDKSGIASFARALERQGVDIISTGGTAELLRKERIPVREISSFTAFPEVLEGRVKTLHPRVHGGLLYKRGNPKHEAEARECGFEPIDLVVVNLYPFEKTIQKPDVTLAEAIENIDIGGPSMIRSAAKKYESVTVVVDPAAYDSVLENISEATNLIAEFSQPTVAILKHTKPCGVGSDVDLRKAWGKAFATDKQAPFGGIIVCNRAIDEPLAKTISEIFSEVIIAPEFETNARALLQTRKNLRLIRLITSAVEARPAVDLRSVCGGLLVQDSDNMSETPEQVVTKRRPTKSELAAMLFGWRVVKHVKSNAIVYAPGDRPPGIGAGQMSRVDSSRIAIWKAEEAGLSLKGSAVASDAFFPFPDGLIAAADAGATCAIQPGGSVRDKEVIADADERKIAMIFTGVRHFRH